MVEDSVEMKVKKSIIGQGGRARISKDTFEELGMKEMGDLIVVSKESKSILVEAYSDVLVDKDYIRLRWSDLNRLDVLEEDIVTINRYKPVGKKITRKVKRIIK